MPSKTPFTRIVITTVLIIGATVSITSINFETAIRAAEEAKTVRQPSKYLVPQKISSATDDVYRVFDENYGIVLYIVEKPGLSSEPSISGQKIQKTEVSAEAGLTQITKKGAISKMYRLIDLEMGTISYLVDHKGKANTPSIATFSIKR